MSFRDFVIKEFCGIENTDNLNSKTKIALFPLACKSHKKILVSKIGRKHYDDKQCQRMGFDDRNHYYRVLRSRNPERFRFKAKLWYAANKERAKRMQLERLKIRGFSGVPEYQMWLRAGKPERDEPKPPKRPKPIDVFCESCVRCGNNVRFLKNMIRCKECYSGREKGFRPCNLKSTPLFIRIFSKQNTWRLSETSYNKSGIPQCNITEVNL